MRRCLDEATLQSYFDGELSGEMLEAVTLHLGSCSTCAATARELDEEINLLTVALAPEFAASVPTERLRQRIDAAVLDPRLGAASARDRVGFGAFISSLLSFGTQRTLGYASLAMVLAFAAIFGLVKLRTTPERTAVVKSEDNVAAVPRPVETGIKPVAVIAQDQNKKADPVYRPVKASFKSNVANKRTEATAPAPTPERVKLLPGEGAYLQTIARLDSTIKAN